MYVPSTGRPSGRLLHVKEFENFSAARAMGIAGFGFPSNQGTVATMRPVLSDGLSRLSRVRQLSLRWLAAEPSRTLYRSDLRSRSTKDRTGAKA